MDCYQMLIDDFRRKFVYIFDEDSAITSKIKRAYCPDGILENNDILYIVEHILFELNGFDLFISREDRHGGDKHYFEYEDLISDFKQGYLASIDIKSQVVIEMRNLLRLIRDQIQDIVNPFVRLKKEKQITPFYMYMKVGRIVGIEDVPAPFNLIAVDIGEKSIIVKSDVLNTLEMEDVMEKLIVVGTNFSKKTVFNQTTQGRILYSKDDNNGLSLFEVEDTCVPGESILLPGTEPNPNMPTMKHLNRFMKLLSVDIEGKLLFRKEAVVSSSGSFCISSIPSSKVESY
eukprot:TRINITY_DN3441_c0_g1_i5.p1 TRINITY_DN3441_c0_g1~~TRINITY_DN3441_c0_g1_i5.p1  ORF type:complete len:288 (-),score=73.53 TRINITY_DN3441_c0_g1_i5:252-1115(-)